MPVPAKPRIAQQIAGPVHARHRVGNGQSGCSHPPGFRYLKRLSMDHGARDVTRCSKQAFPRPHCAPDIAHFQNHGANWDTATVGLSRIPFALRSMQGMRGILPIEDHYACTKCNRAARLEQRGAETARRWTGWTYLVMASVGCTGLGGKVVACC